MIRIDYFSQKLDEIRLKLLEEARKKLDKRLTHLKLIMGDDFDRYNKSVPDGFKVKTVPRDPKVVWCIKKPLKLKSYAQTNKAPKNQAQYYRPIINKEFYFVLHPVIVEVVIQVMYELKLNSFSVAPKKNSCGFSSRNFLVVFNSTNRISSK
ncbi:MAG: hypothetical protein ACJARP_002367 [Vicingaceae bacterium]